MDLIQWDGKQIKKPGIYLGIPISQYHGNPDLCAGKSVSSTGVRLAVDSPYDFWAESHYNPCEKPDRNEKHFDLGQLVHLLTLKDEKFEDHFIEIPEDVLSRNGSTNTNNYKAWARHLGDLRPVKRATILQAMAMAAAVSRKPEVQATLDGIIEATLIWRDEKTGLFLRARPDVLPLSAVYADLKTLGRDVSLRSMTNALEDHKYPVSLAMVNEGMIALTGQELTDYVLVWVGADYPHHVITTPIGRESVKEGASEMRLGIDRIAEGFKTGEWPDRADCLGGWPTLETRSVRTRMENA